MPRRSQRNKTLKKRKRTRGGGPNNKNNNDVNFTMLLPPDGIPGLSLPKPVRRPPTPNYEPNVIPTNWKTPRAQNKYKSIAMNELYPDKPDICPPLYESDRLNKNSSPVVYPVLTNEDVVGKKLKIDETYIFAIKVSEPKTIYYYKDNEFLHIHRTDEEMKAIANRLETRFRGNWSTNRGWSRRVTHNCLTNNEEVICAGDFILKNSKHVIINNNSGHYYPQGECLNYTKYLFQELGFTKVEMNPFHLEQ